MLNKILVPIDFSACADNAVNFAVQSAKILPVEIVLMHAMDIRGSVYNDYLGVNKEYNQEILHDMKTKVAKLKRKIEENEGDFLYSAVICWILVKNLSMKISLSQKNISSAWRALAQV